MKQGLIVLILLGVISCGSFKFDDRSLPYRFISPEEQDVEIEGDYEILDFFDNDKIYITCFYFRDLEKYPRSLIISIVLKKKYAWETFGTVTSKEFDTIRLTEINPRTQFPDWNEYRYIQSLDSIEMAERKTRILRDTISIDFGVRSYKYAPWSRFD